MGVVTILSWISIFTRLGETPPLFLIFPCPRLPHVFGYFNIDARFSVKQFLLYLLVFYFFFDCVSFTVGLPLGRFTFFLIYLTSDWRALSALSDGALHLLVVFSSLNFFTARCIRLSGRMSIPSSYPSWLRAAYLINTLLLHVVYPLNRLVGRSFVVYPLDLSDHNRTLTFPLNLWMSCPHVTMKSSRVFNWILIWGVVAFVSKWDSLIATLRRRYPDLCGIM